MTVPPPVTFLVFGDDWGRHVSSLQHLFAQLTTRTEVIWVNGIGHRPPRVTVTDFRRAWEKAKTMLRGAELPAAVGQKTMAPHRIVAPRVLPWHSRSWVKTLNRWSLRRDILRALETTSPDADVVLVTGSPPSVSVLGQCRERVSIYFCMDDFLELPGVSAEMLAPLERELLRRVDAVVVTAAELLERKRCASGRGYYLPQGVNFEHFAVRQPIPAELRSLPRPIIGFAGGVSTACDLEVIRDLARENADGSVVLVGPLGVERSALQAPNLHVLGARPYSQLPAYVQAFDVGIIPYIESPWTRTVDPLKLLEYLAAGIPVVASPLPEVAKYESVIRIAPLGQDFVRATLESARNVDRSRSERGVRTAFTNSWERRAERFMEIVTEVLSATRPRSAPVAMR